MHCPSLGKMGMRFLAALAVAAGALLLVVGLFSYLVLPGLIESHLATSLQGRYGLEEKPAVEVALGFPPGLLLGRIDWVEVRMDWLKREGLLLRNVHIDLRDVSMLIFARRPGARDPVQLFEGRGAEGFG